MTLFLEGNIWVWKCLFMLESKYKQITYTHWCIHVHMGRQSRVRACARASKSVCVRVCVYALFLQIPGKCIFTPTDELYLFARVLQWLRGVTMFLCASRIGTHIRVKIRAHFELHQMLKDFCLSPVISSQWVRVLTGIILLTAGLSLTSRSSPELTWTCAIQHGKKKTM